MNMIARGFTHFSLSIYTQPLVCIKTTHTLRDFMFRHLTYIYNAKFEFYNFGSLT